MYSLATPLVYMLDTWHYWHFNYADLNNLGNATGLYLASVCSVIGTYFKSPEKKGVLAQDFTVRRSPCGRPMRWCALWLCAIANVRTASESPTK